MKERTIFNVFGILSIFFGVGVVLYLTYIIWFNWDFLILLKIPIYIITVYVSFVLITMIGEYVGRKDSRIFKK